MFLNKANNLSHNYIQITVKWYWYKNFFLNLKELKTNYFLMVRIFKRTQFMYIKIIHRRQYK